MVGLVITIVLVAAAAYATTQIGGIIALAFIAALLLLAYKRASLLVFSLTFTVLLAAYTVLGSANLPAQAWKGFLWALLGLLWLGNLVPLRKILRSMEPRAIAEAVQALQLL